MAQRLLKEKSEQVKALEEKYMQLLQDSGVNVSSEYLFMFVQITTCVERQHDTHV